MDFSCDRCGKRFNTSEEAVPGRTYRIPCDCGATIVLEIGDPVLRRPSVSTRPPYTTPPGMYRAVHVAPDPFAQPEPVADDPFARALSHGAGEGPTTWPDVTPTAAPPLARRDPDAPSEDSSEFRTTGSTSFEDVLRRVRRQGFLAGSAAGALAGAVVAAVLVALTATWTAAPEVPAQAGAPPAAAAPAPAPAEVATPSPEPAPPARAAPPRGEAPAAAPRRAAEPSPRTQEPARVQEATRPQERPKRETAPPGRPAGAAPGPGERAAPPVAEAAPAVAAAPAAAPELAAKEPGMAPPAVEPPGAERVRAPDDEPPDPPPAPEGQARASTPAAARPRPVNEREVAAVLRGRRDAIEACVATLPGDARAARGQRFWLRLDIEPSGRVSRAKIDDPEIEATSLGACVVRVAREMSFASFQGEPAQVDLALQYGDAE